MQTLWEILNKNTRGWMFFSPLYTCEGTGCSRDKGLFILVFNAALKYLTFKPPSPPKKGTHFFTWF